MGPLKKGVRWLSVAFESKNEEVSALGKQKGRLHGFQLLLQSPHGCTNKAPPPLHIFLQLLQQRKLQIKTVPQNGATAASPIDKELETRYRVTEKATATSW